LKRLPSDAVLLGCDETTVRLFTPLRAAWSPKGQQAEVRISGRNAKRVVFVAMNLLSGHRIVTVGTRTTIDAFIAFLEELRRRYRHRAIWLLLDGASYHTHWRIKQRAAELNIELLVLPRQSPKLNPLDHLFGELKDFLANHQIEPIDQYAAHAVSWIMTLTSSQARRKSALLSPNFCLFHLLKNFSVPT
jgi:transposase